MTPEALFSVANGIAAAGWAALIAGIVLRRAWLADLVAGLLFPVVLAAGYVAILLVHFAGAAGGFGSLADVAALFASPWMLLAGWIHYLAFDLFVGAWIARDLARHGASRALLGILMPATFLFGPAGLLSWLALRVARRPLAWTAA